MQVDGKESLLLVVADVEGKGAASALGDGQCASDFACACGSRRDAGKIAGDDQSQTFDGRSVVFDDRRAHDEIFEHVPRAGRERRAELALRERGACAASGDSRGWASGITAGRRRHDRGTRCPDIQFESGVVTLAPGDLMVACTDGITEAMDSIGTEFSRQRMAELVVRVRERGPEEIMRAVLAEVETHSRNGMYEDDRILMVMKAC